MSGREATAGGHTVWLVEDGDGAPVVYLHGFSDIHSSALGWMPFHETLTGAFRVVAPAHPGCAGSEDIEDLDSIDDVVFHYVTLFDELGLDRFHLVGNCVGGWIAAEFAVRYQAMVDRMVLIGAPGLHIPGKPIADLFWYAQPDDGVAYNGLRRLLFASADSPIGKAMYPDGRASIELDMLRYQMFRFANIVGFQPPYLYNPKLLGRLARFKGSALVVHGREEALVPRAIANAYAETLPGARLEIVDGAGHGVVAEKPETAALVRDFLKG